jgi:hypothetical protein
MLRLTTEQRPASLSRGTQGAINDALKERTRYTRSYGNEKVANRWKKAIDTVIHEARSRKHYQDALKVSAEEAMSPVEPFDGSALRKGFECPLITHREVDEDILVISPEIDGRLKDVGRESK